ncbi:MAG: 23S rRNA (adenine(2503)-C(2))-methyltransferase [Coprococcus sp. 43_8]|nr:MAG: 23S rRNA (adenine(2503)-C(2))-methyltransferase [Coprococcus sp. 43_8]
MEKKDIASYSFEELQEEMLAIGEKGFRSRQIYSWIHEKLVDDFEEMTNLPKTLRQKLEAAYEIRRVEMEKRQISKIDGTNKFLFCLKDGNMVESVLMKYKHGNSVCISSQVGCRMGCRFCASTLDGLERNLTPSEMLRQVYQIQKITGERVSNIVIMGTGEPLDNYDNFLKFIHMVSDEHGLNISQRNITASTCGIVPNIRRLAEEKLQITLSVSLHAPDDETRSSIMPVNDAYPVERLMKACRYYFDTTGRRISYEYMMARDKTDRPWQAEKLAKLLRGRPGHVNLIPLNEVEESPLSPSKPETVRRFQQALEKRGVTATVRRKLGPDIDAACGQLRRREMKEQG